MTQQEAKKEIEQLTEKINYHNDLYYQKNRTQISDLEFDKLLEKLIQLENEFPQLKDPSSPTQRVGRYDHKGVCYCVPQIPDAFAKQYL
jgi:DNA ligase (NAD+)